MFMMFKSKLITKTSDGTNERSAARKCERNPHCLAEGDQPIVHVEFALSNSHPNQKRNPENE
jgi:hypothetical protein